MRIFCMFLAAMFLASLHAQEDIPEGGKSADEITRELSNPVGSTASMVFQDTYSVWGGSLDGASSQNSSSLVFLPTLPFIRVEDKVLLHNRNIIELT